jgi:hypothetical protein
MRKRAQMVLVVLAVALLATFALAGSALAFPDVPTSHPFAKAIHDLSVRGIIGGFQNGTFGPDALVTRQQFAKMAVGALYIPVSTVDVCPFTDVDPSEGDALSPDHYVAVVAANKITQGYSATIFGPGNNIYRAHVITMVVRGLENLYPGALKPYSAPWFVPGNWDDLSGEHLNNAKLAYYNGLLDGLDYWGIAKDPMTPMPRGEVAQVLYNMKKLLPDVEMTFAWGETVDFEGARVSVQAPVADPGSTWTQPAPGQKFAAFEIQIENMGATPITTNMFDFTLEDADGYSYTDAEMGSHSDDWFVGETLQPGQKQHAWRVFEIPTGATVDSLVYDPEFTDVALLVWH